MRGYRSKALLTATGVVLITLLALAPPVLAAGHGRFAAAAVPHQFTPEVNHRFDGIVPSARAEGRLRGRPTPGEFAGSTSGAGNLLYWGGPVMATNTTYVIYWVGSSTLSSDYESLINGYFANVAAAQNSPSDVYAVDTQYSGPAGVSAANQSSFGASAIDSTTPIPNDCSAEYARTTVVVSGGCVTDADVQAEVSRVASANKWTLGPTSLFFVFTPQSVGSCFNSTSGQCAYTYYCAYHSSFTDAFHNEVLYADMPYSQNSGAQGACDSGQSPNGNPAADDEISLISHEHNEAITDPEGNAWYDSSGNEIGDKCAWSFGSGPWSSTGNGLNSEYNQTIGTGQYYLQQEWSNASSGCALGYSPPAPAALSVTGFSPSKGTAGSTVTITGTGFAPGDTVSFNGAASTSVTYTSPTQLRATVPAAASSGPITVSGSGAASASATSTGSFSVLPSVTGFSPTSGPVGAQVMITGSGFTGATSVKFGSVSAAFTVTSATGITATEPARAKSGRISVTTPAGTAQTQANFNVTAH